MRERVSGRRSDCIHILHHCVDATHRSPSRGMHAIAIAIAIAVTATDAIHFAAVNTVDVDVSGRAGLLGQGPPAADQGVQ